MTASGAIITGGGTGTITITNGTLNLTNTESAVGAPAAPIGTLSLSGATLHLRISGSSAGTNIIVGNLAASGVNAITIDAVPNLTTTTTFPLFAYSTFSGSVSNNFVLTPLPGNYAGSLVDNAARKTIDLRVTHSTGGRPAITSVALSGANLVLGGANGPPTWNYYLLSSTNVALPASNWTAITTSLFDGVGNFQVTNAVDLAVLQRFFMIQVP